ncbi:MAG: carboxypeptidase regulatory-like domain-containing protein [Deltaproteobacteria bacterium]|nr:MAG: carboxypeptidase regulatory-like domain-containing protein [Deltaproteobacteria bacterium]
MAGSATSGPDGTFRVGGLLPGTYVVRAAGRGHCGTAARTVTVGLGETARSDVAATPCGRLNVRVVVGPNERPCLAGTVRLFGFAADAFAARPVDADGRAAFEAVPLGRHAGSAACGGLPPAFFSANVGTPGEIEHTVRIADEPYGVLEVAVTDDRGAPVFGARVEPHADAAPCCGAGTTDASGVARFAQAVPGTYRIAAEGAGEAVTAAVEPGETSSVALRLEAPAGAVDGRVRAASGEPVAAARLWLRPADPGVLVPRAVAAMSDPQGRFAVEGLAPGPYRIVVEGGRVRGGDRVTVEAGTRVETEVIVDDRICDARIVVRGPDGPLADVPVTLEPEDGPGGAAGGHTMVTSITDEDGVATAEGLAVGTYRVRAGAVGPIQTKAIQVTCTGEGPVAATVDLEEAASVEGRVVPACAGTLEATPVPSVVGEGRRAAVPSDGSFHLEGLLPGRPYALHFFGCGRAGVVQVEGLAAGERRTDLVVETRPVADLEGRVVDRCGEPVAGVRVVPVGALRVGHLMANEAESDAEGRVRIPAVAAGEGPVELAFVGRYGGGRVRVAVPAGGGTVDVGDLVYGAAPARCEGTGP